LQAFDDLCQELAKRLSSSELEPAIWFLSQARHSVRADWPDEALFRPLSLSDTQKRRLRELMTYPAFDEGFEPIRYATRTGRSSCMARGADRHSGPDPGSMTTAGDEFAQSAFMYFRLSRE
jgi:hypothetical protein